MHQFPCKLFVCCTAFAICSPCVGQEQPPKGEAGEAANGVGALPAGSELQIVQAGKADSLNVARVSPGKIAAGRTFKYYILVGNGAEEVAEAIVVRERVNEGFEVLGAVLKPSGEKVAPVKMMSGSAGGGAVSYDFGIGSLEAGAQATIVVTGVCSAAGKAASDLTVSSQPPVTVEFDVAEPVVKVTRRVVRTFGSGAAVGVGMATKQTAKGREAVALAAGGALLRCTIRNDSAEAKKFTFRQQLPPGVTARGLHVDFDMEASLASIDFGEVGPGAFASRKLQLYFAGGGTDGVRYSFPEAVALDERQVEYRSSEGLSFIYFFTQPSPLNVSVSFTGTSKVVAGEEVRAEVSVYNESEKTQDVFVRLSRPRNVESVRFSESPEKSVIDEGDHYLLGLGRVNAGALETVEITLTPAVAGDIHLSVAGHVPRKKGIPAGAVARSGRAAP